MRILVTGGSGFTGGYVIRSLRKYGHEIVALGRSEAARARVGALGAEAVAGDLDDPVSVTRAFQHAAAEILVNVASLGFGHAPTVVDAASHASLRTAVFLSTTAIFTRLDVPTRATRLAAERTIAESDLTWTILRPSMIYGAPGDRNMERLLRFVKRSPVVPVPGGGRALQQPVHVEDVAAAVTAVVARYAALGSFPPVDRNASYGQDRPTTKDPPVDAQAYNIAGPSPMPLRRLLMVAAAAVGRSPRLLSIPVQSTAAAVGLYERHAQRPRLRTEQILRLIEDKSVDISAATKDLDFRPRSFEDGIAAEALLL